MNSEYVVITRDGRKVFEHRHIMEGVLGRKLERGDHVHHRNGDRRDNRPANLEVLDASTHGLMHSPLRTHCRRGHPLDGENVYYVTRSKKKGRSCVERWCRTCRDARQGKARS